MDWTSAEAALESGVASVFDVQTVELIPRKAAPSVNAPSVADATRAAFTCKVSLELSPPGIARADGDPSDRERRTFYEAVMTGDWSAWPWQPKRDDLVRVPGQDWQVRNIDRDGSRRFIIYLNRSR